jgi:hypothetical protein
MRIIFIFLYFVISITGFTQSINEEKTTLSNFIKRMYNSTPFEGVKIMDDYDHQYLVSVVSLDKTKYTNPSIMNRVAQVKSQSQASTFLNGATINMEMVIKTTERKSKGSSSVLTETIESIKQNSSGFSQGLELLSNFDSSDNNRTIFIYIREIKK